MGLQTAHLAGGEVGDDDDAASDEFFGGVRLGDAGEDLALLVAEVELEAEELVGLGYALGDDDLCDAEIDLDEVVDGDLGGVGGGGGSGRRDEGPGGEGFGVGWGPDEVGPGDRCSTYLGSGVFFGEGAGARGRAGVRGVCGDCGGRELCACLLERGRGGALRWQL